jgi:hypothetical protein
MRAQLALSLRLISSWRRRPNKITSQSPQHPKEAALKRKNNWTHPQLKKKCFNSLQPNIPWKKNLRNTQMRFRLSVSRGSTI